MKKEILELLKEKNIKITNERKEIIVVLEETKTPLSPAEISLRIRPRLPKANITTVYRNLELLESLNLIKRISFNTTGFSYELVSSRAHHHHIVCTKCGTVDDIENISENFLGEVEALKGFRVEDHNLELFGVCKKCQKL